MCGIDAGSRVLRKVREAESRGRGSAPSPYRQEGKVAFIASSRSRQGALAGGFVFAHRGIAPRADTIEAWPILASSSH